MKNTQELMLKIKNELSKKYEVIIENFEDKNAYFILQDNKGYRVYLQPNTFPFMGCDVSIKYKPSKQNGSGKSYATELNYNDIDKICEVVERAFNDARMYPKDTRKPHSTGKYCI